MIRPATTADLAAIIALERECREAGHWTDAQYEALLRSGLSSHDAARRLVLVFDESGAVLGFLVAQHVTAEWELENIAVAPAARRRGVGRQLIEELLKAASETHSESVFLEVRESNARARSLYEKAGFVESGCRKSYYSNPVEDAILLRRTIEK